MNMPMISIVIPMYNAEEYIEECLLSVVNQSFRNLEIIIVDDASQDNSVEKAQRILKKLEWRYVIIRQTHNQGQAVARNKGVQQATGKYLFFLDSDDYMMPDCLRLLLNAAEAEANEMTFGNYRILVDEVIQKGFREREIDAVPPGNMIETYFAGMTSTAPWNRLILREWYLGSGVLFPEGHIHEDEPWSFSLALRCSKFAFVNDITYIVRQSKQSTTRSPENAKRRAEGHVVRVRESHREITKLGAALPEKFFLWHNRILKESMFIIANLLPDDYLAYVVKAIRYAWVPSFSKIRELPFRELRYLYYFRYFFSDRIAYLLSCKCMAAYLLISSFAERMGLCQKETRQDGRE